MTDIGEIVKRQVRGGDASRLVAESVAWVYILTNPSMPDLVKIGITRGDVHARAQALSSTTGVPTPFEIYFAMRCICGADVEKRIHSLLSEFRVNPSREFFQCSLDQAKAALWLADIEVGELINEEQFNAAYSPENHNHFFGCIGGGQGMLWHA